MKVRVGFGYDNHRLEEGRPLIVGGVNIPFEKGLVGHSDADILLHAICDALLGAANLRDIGFHFSDKDPKYKNIDSRILLRDTNKLLLDAGYGIGNIDCTIVAEQPKFSPYIPEMKKIISEILGIPEEDLSIKAKTNEKLDAIGEGRGMVAYAVALIHKS